METKFYLIFGNWKKRKEKEKVGQNSCIQSVWKKRKRKKQNLQPQKKTKIFQPCSADQEKKEKSETLNSDHIQYEHSILCKRSLRIPLYKATRFSGIWFLQLLSTLLEDSTTFSTIFASSTFSAKLTFFFFPSLFLKPKRKQTKNPQSWNLCHSFQRRRLEIEKTEETHVCYVCTWRQARS